MTWSGIYLGVQGGGGWGAMQRRTAAGAFTSEWDVEGGLGGGHLGGLYQWNRLVLGVEGDVEWGDLEGDDGGLGGAVDETEYNLVASIRGRLGLAFNRFLVYGTGGWQRADIDVTQSALGQISIFDQNYDGWTAGGGAEFAVTNHVVAGIEYRYTEFDRESFPATGIFTAGSYDVEDWHAVRARFSVKW